MVDAAIAARAELAKHGIPHWEFIPTGELLVNDAHHPALAHIGELLFNDPWFITSVAIQSGKWVFCLTRHREDTSPDNEWIVTGFCDDSLHFFAEVHGDPDPRPKFCLYVVNTFWPLLHPNGACGLVEGQEFRISMRTIFTSEAEVNAMVRQYRRSGGPPDPIMGGNIK
jgi:hypothetical protein